MSDQFLAEIRIFALNYAPQDWAFCDGQMLPLSQNQTLFSVLGTTYGGNGTTYFVLPAMQACVPIQQGQGVGLTSRAVGALGGAASVTLIASQLPAHSHDLMADAQDPADLNAPSATRVLAQSGGVSAYQPLSTSGLGAMAEQALGAAGGNALHTNLQPFLPLNFCIALVGLFPSSS